MSERLPVDAEAGVGAAGERVVRVRKEFERAWEGALNGQAAPTLDAFLERVPEPERKTLQGILRDVERGYRARVAASSPDQTKSLDHPETVEFSRKQPAVLGQTLDAPATRAGHPAEGATLDFPSVRPMETGDPHPPIAHEAERPPTPVANTLKYQQANILDPGFSLDDDIAVQSAPDLPFVAGYQIERVLGRGGMGVVYLATQKGLGRQVALKMVLAGAHANPTQLARFQTEAHAVAHLQHPNIVQIYDVGEHEGLPYFSLEYVDGGDLADKIDRKPQPPRQTAQMLEVLALAMAFAHQNGIIHRDLKPVNVLLNKDGLPKITDFGLAKCLEGQSGQTQSGDIMGTPSYMAPEQASGSVRAITPLVDVYSLGAILYEMLTGRPPFLGASIMETLDQVRTQEPVPPRSLQPNVPVDLETICVKCLQKDPQKRYAGAETLAEDLHRFLAGEPIRARPVGNLERLWRWCHRNPRVAALSAAVLALLVLVSVGSVIAAVQINFEKHAAEFARDLADKSATQAREAQRRADDNARVAQDQTNLTVKTFYQVVVEVQNALRDRPDMQKLREKLLNDSLAGLNEVAKSAENSNLLQRTLGGAYQRMGDVALEMGQTAEAQKQYQQALSIFEQLAAKDREDDVSRWNLAVMYEKIGTVNHRLRGDIAKTENFYRQATRLREALATGPRHEPKLTQPLVDNALASSYAAEANLAVLMGKPAVVRDYLQKAVKLREELAAADARSLPAKEALATLYITLGQTSFHLRDPAAQEHYQKALQLREALAKADPDSVAFQNGLVDAHQKIGDMLLHLKGAESLAAVREHYTIAHELQQKLYQKNPKNTGMRQALASSLYRLGAIAQRQGDGVESQKQFRACLQLREALAADDPKNLYKQVELLLAQARCGEHAKAAESAGRLRKEAAEDASILYYLGCGYALCALATGADQSSALREQYLRDAVATLGQAVERGYHDLVSLETDPDLEALQEMPAYKELLAKLKGH